MTTIGIINAGEVGSHLARAAIASGYKIVIANSRGPETLERLIEQLGPSARAASATGAAAAGEFVVVAVPLKLVNDMPVTELAGKVVIDTNNYMAWRDRHYPIVDRGKKTEHVLRQDQLPASKVVKAFTHIQAPRIITWGRPAGSPNRLALSASCDFPEAVEIVRRLYDQFGFDTVDNSPLSESWRTMLSVLRLVRCRTLDHMISMSANTETQFTLFDRPSSRDGHQAPHQQRRAQLPDLVRDVSQLENDDLIDLIRVALGEARRHGMAAAASVSSRTMPPVMEQKNPAAARIVRNTAPKADIPPAKASMVRAAVRAGFSPARVAKDFGVSTATVRKLMAS